MKTYTGTKIVNAKPMTRGEYNIFRGWELPADENGSDEGYLVEYTDGGKANTTAYTGYVSWSPKDVFERAYRVILLPYQQSVVDEKVELDKKRAALADFIESYIYERVGEAEQMRLLQQERAMLVYSQILGERIGAF